ncbi:MAG: hypothetical protein LBU89_10910 [Fibromonadaceae bacterium]|jgi:hypothetical protein|nr:hypothetical protein [Fibromonadaceae bacterium]
MSAALAVGGGAALLGGVAKGVGSYFGNKDASKEIEKGTQQALAQNDKYRQQLAGLYGDVQGNADKYAALLQQAGAGFSPIDSAKYLQGAAALDPGTFSGNVDVTKDPGYQFRMDEAQKAPDFINAPP